MGISTNIVIAIIFPCFALIHGQAGRFNHPALVNNLQELQFIKGKIKAGESPWKEAFEKMKADGFASIDYTPKPRTEVGCGYSDNPNNGCEDERNDAKAAYTHALMWMFTDDEAHARTAVKILNAWSILKDHTNGGNEVGNAPLQAGWAGELFPMAAEIMRYTYKGWNEQEIKRFSDMLSRAMIPRIYNGHPTFNGNWELTMIGAMLQIAVFQDDTELFNHALAMYRKRVPAYLYIEADGPLPVRPSGAGAEKFNDARALIDRWFNPGIFINGLCQETCRDLGHTQMGLASIWNGAEIGWHQGLDLYGEFGDRITKAMEFNAGLLLNRKAPAGLCGGNVNYQSISATWEQAYNNYHNRMGKELPLTKMLLEKVRPTGKGLFFTWESMTHAQLGGRSTPYPVSVRATARGQQILPSVFFRNGGLAVKVPRTGDYSISLSDPTGKEIGRYRSAQADPTGFLSITAPGIPIGMYLVGIKEAGKGAPGTQTWIRTPLIDHHSGF